MTQTPVRDQRQWFARPRLSVVIRIAALALAAQLLLAVLVPLPALAAGGDLTSVIDSIRVWVAGILAGLATPYLRIGGGRYLMPDASPRAMEQRKAAIGSTVIGY